MLAFVQRTVNLYSINDVMMSSLFGRTHVQYLFCASTYVRMIPRAFCSRPPASLLRRVGFRVFASSTFVGREATSRTRAVSGVRGPRCAPIRIPRRRLSAEGKVSK